MDVVEGVPARDGCDGGNDSELGDRGGDDCCGSIMRGSFLQLASSDIAMLLLGILRLACIERKREKRTHEGLVHCGTTESKICLVVPQETSGGRF